jgi:hypothetical protein
MSGWARHKTTFQVHIPLNMLKKKKTNFVLPFSFILRWQIFPNVELDPTKDNI